jgi:GntR family transcriptional regulator, rspAB operon transcriptional repressor
MALPSPAEPRTAPPGRLDRDRRAAPQVYERLRGLITALTLPPGAPLSRTALAAEYGLSSTPIRDALMRLSEEGLVDVFPQHATLVSRIDVRQAELAHFLRQALELEIVRILAQPAEPALLADLSADLDALIARQRRSAKDGNLEAFMAADNEFHARLYVAADKQDLWRLVRSRSGHIDRLRRLHLPSPGRVQAIVRHHRLIAQAIGNGKPDEAQTQLRVHLSGTLGDLATIRSHHPGYLTE